MTLLQSKTYDLKNGFGIDCRTYSDVLGNRRYVIEVVMLEVPWREVVDGFEGINDLELCNNEFKRLKSKYGSLKGGFI